MVSWYLRLLKLLTDPLSEAEFLFECCDTTMMTLVDKYTPFAEVKIRSHHNTPWYGDDCRTHQQERIYRDKKCKPDRVAWHAQTRHQRFIFIEKYVLYWSVAIKNNTDDPKALWS